MESDIVVRLSIEGPPERVLALATVLSTLLEDRSLGGASELEAEPAEFELNDARLTIEMLWPRLSPLRRRILVQAAEHPPGEVFSIRQLADELTEQYTVVRSSLNSLGRSLKTLRREVPNTPSNLFVKRWNAASGEHDLQLVPEIHTAIVEARRSGGE